MKRRCSIHQRNSRRHSAESVSRHAHDARSTRFGLDSESITAVKARTRNRAETPVESHVEAGGADQASEPGQGPALYRPGGREEGVPIAFHPMCRGGGD